MIAAVMVGRWGEGTFVQVCRRAVKWGWLAVGRPRWVGRGSVALCWLSVAEHFGGQQGVYLCHLQPIGPRLYVKGL